MTTPPSKWAAALSSVDAQPARAPTPRPTSPPGGFWRRECAYVLDLIPFQVVGHVIMAPLALDPLNISPLTVGLLFVWSILGLVAWAAYHIESEARWGTTPGKYLVGLRVENSSAQSLSRREAIIRFCSAGLSWLTLNVGHALAAFRSDKAMLHDMVSSTRVVHDTHVSIGGHPALSETAQQRWFIGALIAQALALLVFTIGMIVLLRWVMDNMHQFPIPA